MKTYPIILRLKFYVDWYAIMDYDERNSFTGGWVAERIYLLSEALKETISSVKHTRTPIGEFEHSLNGFL